ncbi:MAG: non-histone chromosomal MC1 family protein [Methanothrix sp.]
MQVDKPKGAPAWMMDKIWKPNVNKVGVELFEEGLHGNKNQS